MSIPVLNMYLRYISGASSISLVKISIYKENIRISSWLKTNMELYSLVMYQSYYTDTTKRRETASIMHDRK